ncbi:MAG: epoxyqueuosine reductase QueH [Deltaproteobacteria bacterium]|nr:MAG: epoxyqueuosine reductase QueH [Deltaproteobacteria bacterium]
MKVLLHICCAPCSIYPLEVLEGEGCRVFGFFFNPNIHPYQEYRLRLETLQRFAEHVALEVIYRDEYDVVSFLREVVFRETQRCYYCYHLRLDAAARLAKKSHMDAFTTTLLYSKRQKHELIRELGDEMSHRHGIPFVYRDLRQGWQVGVQQSKELNLYRQQYCGCIFSEQERFLGFDSE